MKRDVYYLEIWLSILFGAYLGGIETDLVKIGSYVDNVFGAYLGGIETNWACWNHR